MPENWHAGSNKTPIRAGALRASCGGNSPTVILIIIIVLVIVLVNCYFSSLHHHGRGGSLAAGPALSEGNRNNRTRIQTKLANTAEAHKYCRSSRILQ